MLSKEWMIYGANGYTGRLLVRLAKKRGLQPILAGRSQDCLLYTSPSPRDISGSRMPSSA